MAQADLNGIVLVFATGLEERVAGMIDRLRHRAHVGNLYIVSEFPPSHGRWIPYHRQRGWAANRAAIVSALQGQPVQYSAVLLDPQSPYWRLRLLAFSFTHNVLLFNENGDHYTLRPRSWPGLWRHALWRLRAWVRWQRHPGGDLYTLLWRVRHPGAFARPLVWIGARLSGQALALAKHAAPAQAWPTPMAQLPPGISVVIPSRNGRDLLAKLFPTLLPELPATHSEIIVADNGSEDGTAAWLAAQHPEVIVELSAEPLSFAAAVNRGIRRARYSHVCLLNNDMLVEAGFFRALQTAFKQVPDLFCATAQIFFPPGERRQETGKAVKPFRPTDTRDTSFPVRCEEALPGENLSYVLYGSGGCSLYDTAKLRLLGGMGELFRPAYVEDLDAGYRAWQRGWASVFVADARVVHYHRQTSARYYTEDQLQRVLEINYLRFLVRAVADPSVFRELWQEAIWRLNLLGAQHTPQPTAVAALAFASQAARWLARPPAPCYDERLLLALGSGDVAVFPGQSQADRPVVLVASPYLPFPLSHGGAVRMFNLMRRAAPDYTQILVCFVEELASPPPELLALCAEVVLVRRRGTHLRPNTARPDGVEEFASAAFRAALQQMMRKWQPSIAQLEFTQMAQYAPDCRPAQTVLVEHDITYDLYGQFLALQEDWETRRQYERWVRFENDAWRQVDCVAVMSEKDQQAVTGAPAVLLRNGVDIVRYQPGGQPPEPHRLLFIGAFRHLPNLAALDFFLNGAWPLLQELSPTLHVIAGAEHRKYWQQYPERARVPLQAPGLMVEDFVPDVRPAYHKASVVLAPLQASAGTNIKVLEAMAMGKAVVSTSAGLNGLDLSPGQDVLVADTPSEMAAAIRNLLQDASYRQEIEQAARRTAATRFDWGRIAQEQAELYEELLARSGEFSAARQPYRVPA